MPSQRLYYNGTTWIPYQGGGSPATPPPVVDSFNYRTTKPTALNTGTGFGRDAFGNVVVVPKPTEIVTGTIDLTTPNQVYKDKIVIGHINTKAAGVTVRNVEIRMPAFTTPGAGNDVWGIYCNYSALDGANRVTIEFCEIWQSSPTYHSNGVGSRNFVLQRCDIHDVVDCVSLYNATNYPTVSGKDAPSLPLNAIVRGNYLHHTLWITPDPNHSDNKTHNDVIQMQGSDGGEIYGNTIVGLNSPNSTQPTPERQNTCLQMAPGVSRISNIMVEDNWFYGGIYAVNAGADMGLSSGQFNRNKFDRDQFYVGRTIVFGLNNSGFTTSGNVYEDDGSPITVRRG